MISWLETTSLATSRIQSSTFSSSDLQVFGPQDNQTSQTYSLRITYATTQNWSNTNSTFTQAGTSWNNETSSVDLATSEANTTTLETANKTTTVLTNISRAYVASTQVTDFEYFYTTIQDGETTISSDLTTQKSLNVVIETDFEIKSTTTVADTVHVGGGVVYNSVYEAVDNEIFFTAATSEASSSPVAASNIATTTRFSALAQTQTSSALQVSEITPSNQPTLSTSFVYSQSEHTTGFISAVSLFTEFPPTSDTVQINSLKTQSAEIVTQYFFPISVENPVATTEYYQKHTKTPVTVAGVVFDRVIFQTASFAQSVQGQQQVTTNSSFTDSYSYLVPSKSAILVSIADHPSFCRTISGPGGQVLGDQTGALLTLLGYSKTFFTESSTFMAAVKREAAANGFYGNGPGALAKLHQFMHTIHTFSEETASSRTISGSVSINDTGWSETNITASKTTQEKETSSGELGLIGESYVGSYRVDERASINSKYAPSIVYPGEAVIGGKINPGETLYQMLGPGAYKIGSGTTYFSGAMSSYAESQQVSVVTAISYFTPFGSGTVGSNLLAWSAPRNSTSQMVEPEIVF